MAVRIVNEAVYDKKFQNHMDSYWDELNRKYQDDKYKDFNREEQSVNDKNGISAVDHETGKFILDSVDHYLDSLDYKIQYDFDESDEELTKVINNAFYNKGSEEEKYNGFERATKRVKRHLSFNDPKDGKDGDYNIELLIEVRVRTVMSEIGNSLDRNSKEIKCKVLLISNIRSLPFEDLKKEYKQVYKLISQSIAKMKRENFWEIDELNSFSLEDISYINPKQNSVPSTNKSKRRPKRTRTK